MPTDELLDQLRDQDLAVLACIRKGENDVQQIKAATTLNKRQVNYVFEKLEKLGLIEVHRPEGQVERIIDGQKRVFDAPKESTLTETGIHYFHTANNDGGHYEDLTRDEIVEDIHELEDRINQLEREFEAFRQQVLQKIK